MNNIVKSWLRRQRDMGRERRKAELSAQAKAVIQVREFGGELYYSYRGAPLIRVEDVRLPYAEALEKSRAAYVAYMEE